MVDEAALDLPLQETLLIETISGPAVKHILQALRTPLKDVSSKDASSTAATETLKAQQRTLIQAQAEQTAVAQLSPLLQETAAKAVQEAQAAVAATQALVAPHAANEVMGDLPFATLDRKRDQTQHW